MLRTCLLIVAATLLTFQVAWAEDTTPKDAPPADASVAATESESQQMARTKLMDMAKLLAGTEKFSVALRIGYDSVQENGQKIEFGEIRTVMVQRPDRARIEEQASQGGRDLLLFDGKNITVQNGESGVYAQAPQPGDLDATVKHFVRDLKMRLPLAPMLMKGLPDEFQRRIQSIEYVEHTDILGEPAHHIAARTATVDFQVWIADSDRPLPLRIVMTYPMAEGQPQFWAQFSKWDLSPAIETTAFQFTPPAEAKKISFAAQIPSPSVTPQASGNSEQGGKP